MEHIFHTFKQVWQIERRSILTQMGFTLIVGLVGIGFVLVVMATVAPEDYGKLGTFFSLLVGVIVSLFGEVFTVQSSFNTAISMGKTRKSFIPAKYLVAVSGTAMLVLTISIINWIEGLLYTKLYPNVVCELDFDVVLGNPAICIGYAIGVPAVALLLGGLYMKFGTKFFWVMWAIWMITFLVLPRITEAMEENPDSLPAKIGFSGAEFFKDITMTQGAIAFVVCLVVVIVGNVLIFRKQRVVV